MRSEADASEPGGMANEKPIGAATEKAKTFDWSGAAPEGVVCPACWGELGCEQRAGAETLVCGTSWGDPRAGSGSLVCVACGRRYPVVNGIPVLIVERAEQDRTCLR